MTMLILVQHKTIGIDLQTNTVCEYTSSERFVVFVELISLRVMV